MTNRTDKQEGVKIEMLATAVWKNTYDALDAAKALQAAIPDDDEDLASLIELLQQGDQLAEGIKDRNDNQASLTDMLNHKLQQVRRVRADAKKG